MIHYIDSDLELFWGWPHWQWLSVGEGLLSIETYLAKVARFQDLHGA